MKIIADENIAFVKQVFGNSNELILKSGRLLTQSDLVTADMLLVRSITPVNQKLLHNTSVKFVGSVTTGIDHLDTKWLNDGEIAWSAAEGCNTIAVAEYVVAVIAALQQSAVLPKTKCRAGVIGVGRIGSQVVDKLKILGFDVIQCDPIRALHEKDFFSTPIDDFSNLDFIAVHTPLTHEGQYATYHLINKLFLRRQKKNCVLLNAGRGDVVDFSDLEEYGRCLYWCLDVWEHEPVINFDVLQIAEIATPHIAGYSAQSKCRAIESIYHAASQYDSALASNPPTITYPTRTISFHNKSVTWQDVVLTVYDPYQTTKQMKDALLVNNSEQTFDLLRKNFEERDEFAYVTIVDAKLTVEDQLVLKQLGFVFSQ